MMYVPRGFAHGFLTLERDTEAFYLVSARRALERPALCDRLAGRAPRDLRQGRATVRFRPRLAFGGVSGRADGSRNRYHHDTRRGRLAPPCPQGENAFRPPKCPLSTSKRCFLSTLWIRFGRACRQRNKTPSAADWQGNSTLGLGTVRHLPRGSNLLVKSIMKSYSTIDIITHNPYIGADGAAARGPTSGG
jgi:hypothetical protein